MSLYDRDWYRKETRERAGEHRDEHRSARGARATSAFEQWAKQEEASKHRLRPDLNIFRWIAFWILVLIVTSLLFQWVDTNWTGGVAPTQLPIQQANPDPVTSEAPKVTPHQQPAALPAAVIIRPTPAPERTTPQPVGRSMQLALSPQANGNFIAPGTINGRSVRFLIDTGATFLTVPEKLKGALGLSRGPYFRSKTANGVVSHYGTRIERMSLGPLELREVPGALNPHAPDDTVLLGMSALRGLDLIHTNGQLILRQPADHAAQAMKASAASVPVLGMPLFKRRLSSCLPRDKLVDERVLACMEGR